MNKKCAFTICTRSYLGLADTLRNSFLKFNEDFDFYIIFADFVDNELDFDYVLSAKTVMNIEDSKFYEMAFKYNVTEFCTSIKPFGHLYFFEKGYDSVFYFDPDILFYSRFNEIYEERYSVYLTPHVVNMTPKIRNDWGQEDFLKYGTFNCGFVGFRNDAIGKKVVVWWADQLKNKAFADSDKGLYTDQKWMDIIPAFVDLGKICVIKNLGCDFAPWNYSERKCVVKNECFYAQNREDENDEYPLCFVHYSAYNYRKLLENNEIFSTYKLTHYEDEDQLVWNYANELRDNNTLNRLSIPYLYATYKNGDIITNLHRCLYNQLLQNGEDYGNPFEDERFWKIMKQNKLISKQDLSKVGKGSVKNYSGKSSQIDRFFRIAFKILGVDRYTLLLRKIAKNANYRNNIFLIK